MNPSLIARTLAAVIVCGVGASAFAEDDLLSKLKQRLAKEKSRLKSKPKSSPPQPITWEQFLAAEQNRGVPRSDLARRFRVADSNHDDVLTPTEIEAHRKTAAKNKARKK